MAQKKWMGTKAKVGRPGRSAPTLGRMPKRAKGAKRAIGARR